MPLGGGGDAMAASPQRQITAGGEPAQLPDAGRSEKLGSGVGDADLFTDRDTKRWHDMD
jgi:hypothetical protein